MHRLDRRTFLRSAGAAFAASLTPGAAEALDGSDSVFGTAFISRDGSYGVALLGDSGQLITTTAMPARGHEVVFSKSNRAVVFARRPGTFAMTFTTDGAAEPILFSSPADRHFYGHGVFSEDGKLLFATENDFENAQGVVGVYDATNRYQRLGEFPTHGTGPHDIVAMGSTLAVVNGGLETHPDFGRTKLNIATMQPSLVFLDMGDGRLLGRHMLADNLSKVSIRHMVHDRHGQLYIAGQHEGNPARIVPLIARWHADDGLTMLPVAAHDTARLKGYIGSIALNRGQLAVSSPKAGVVLRFAVDDPTRAEIISQKKVCGVAAQEAGFATTSLAGTTRMSAGKLQNTELLWDNHLSVRQAG